MTTATPVRATASPVGTPQEPVRSRVAASTVVFWAALAGVFGVLAFNLFTALGAGPIADWDESRHAVSAYEMLQRGDWIGNTWRGQLDYWNLKPPLSMWAQMLSYQAFGFTPFAFRLPSVLATFLTVAVVAFASHRLAGRVAAVVSALALTTSSHFLLTHSARTGDPDALFLLGATVGLLAFLAAPRHPRLLLLATSAVSFAFLAKGFHVALLLVFAVGYLLVTRRSGRVRGRDAALSLLGFVPLAAWAAVRFAYDGTVFLTSMFTVDVLHRTEAPAEGNTAAVQYYSKLLVTSYWMWLAVLVVAVGVCVLLRRRGALVVGRPLLTVAAGLAVWAVGVVGVFSLMATKLAWYALVAYPALAVLIGVAVALAVRATAPSRVAAGAAVAAIAVTTAIAQQPIAVFVTNPGTDDAQSVLLSLDRDQRHLGQAVYLDPALGWSQGLVAAAELGGGLRPVDGGTAAAVADPGSLALLQRSTAAAAGVDRVPGAVVEAGDAFVLVRTQALIEAAAAR